VHGSSDGGNERNSAEGQDGGWRSNRNTSALRAGASSRAALIDNSRLDSSSEATGSSQAGHKGRIAIAEPVKELHQKKKKETFFLGDLLVQIAVVLVVHSSRANDELILASSERFICTHINLGKSNSENWKKEREQLSLR
jgi:hypothetical protein